MDVMWQEDRPLSRSEIIDRSQGSTWKSSSIHILLNQMLEKGAIIVDGFVKTGKNYGRTFKPTITLEEYQVMQLKQNIGGCKVKPDTLVHFVAAPFSDEVYSRIKS